MSSAMSSALRLRSDTPAARMRRRALAAIVDALAWIVSILLAVLLRFEFDPSSVNWVPSVILALIAAGAQVAFGYSFALYRGRYAYGSFDEVRMLAAGVTLQAFALALLVIAFGNTVGIPRSTVFIAYPFVLLIMFGVRYSARLVLEHERRPTADAARALVAGAGYLGDALIHAVMTDPTSPFRPVGLLDDDPAKRNLRLRGVPVLGHTDQIADAAARTGATVLVIAIGDADSELIRTMTERAEAAGMTVFVTPTVAKLMTGEASVTDLRGVTIEDLIGRAAVDTKSSRSPATSPANAFS